MRASIADGFGDRAVVETRPATRVWLTVHPKGEPGDGITLALTPKKARRLAKALKRASKEISA